MLVDLSHNHGLLQ